MKTLAKTLLGGAIAQILVILGICCLPFLASSCSGNDKDDCLKKACWVLGLPENTVTSEFDNLNDKSASWDSFEFNIRFNKVGDVAKMEREMLEQCKQGGYWKLQDGTITFSNASVPVDGDSRNDEYIYFTHRLGSDYARVNYEKER